MKLISSILTRVINWPKNEPVAVADVNRKNPFFKKLAIDKEVYLSNLQLTQLFYNQQLVRNKGLSKAKVLRSINPKMRGLQLFTFENQERVDKSAESFETTVWNPKLEDSFPEIIGEIYELQLKLKNRLVVSNEVLDLPGKILKTDLNSLLDGASEYESEGIIDVYDLPPIDTWFYLASYHQSMILFSWIPSEYVEEVQAAIEVNALDLLGWYEEEMV